MPNDEIGCWSVGELARAARVTVRTLHHYDRLGLVTPSGRTTGGHRRYDQDDLTRLLRVLSLRDLGFVLEELPALLDQDQGPEPSAALLATARAHRARVAEQLQHQVRLRDRLEVLIAGLKRGDPPSSDVLLTTLEAMAMTVHLTRIYTRRGDDGRTDLADTARVPKTAPQVEAIGAVDELNAALGVAATTAGLPARFVPWLQRIQNDLFDIGAQLARPDPDHDSTAAVPPGQSRHRIDQGYTTWLEQLCDQVNADLPALRSFVLPGGTAAAAHLHLARTICRRAERRALATAHPDTDITCYLNRLSDLLFILSRAANTPVEELLWEPGRHSGGPGAQPPAAEPLDPT